MHVRRLELLTEVRNCREGALRWSLRWDKELRKLKTQKDDSPAKRLGEGDVQMSLAFKVAMMLCNRFLTALGVEQGLALQRETCQYAQELLNELENPRYRLGSVNAVFCRAGAKAIQAYPSDGCRVACLRRCTGSVYVSRTIQTYTRRDILSLG